MQDDNLVIYIGGLHDEINETMLYSAFHTFGEIKDVFLPRDKTVDKKHRGYGFIEFFNHSDAKAAVDNMHMNQIYGCTIRCNMARANIHDLKNPTAGVSLEPFETN